MAYSKEEMGEGASLVFTRMLNSILGTELDFNKNNPTKNNKALGTN